MNVVPDYNHCLIIFTVVGREVRCVISSGRQRVKSSSIRGGRGPEEDEEAENTPRDKAKEIKADLQT